MSDQGASDAENLAISTKRRINLTTFAALLALLSSGVAAVFALWPELRPDPRSTRQARISVFAVERGVRYGQFLERTSPPGGPVRQISQGPEPTVTGELVYVKATVSGFKRSSVSLRWSAYDATTDKQVRVPDLHGVPDVQRTLETPTDTFVQPIWIYPLVCSDQRFFVRVELLDEAGLILAVADSTAFPGLPPECKTPFS